MGRRKHNNAGTIPRYLREAFNALRQRPDDDPPGRSFALTAIAVDGQPRWAIVAVIEDGTETVYMPLFTALHPGARVSMAGLEAQDATNAAQEAFQKLDE
jgi:hypothetical protein